MNTNMCLIMTSVFTAAKINQNFGYPFVECALVDFTDKMLMHADG